MAAASHSTVTAFIEDALREALARRHRIGRYEQVILKTYGKQGLLPGVDIDDTASMLDLMESSDDPAGRHCEWITTDLTMPAFQSLRWKHPLS